MMKRPFLELLSPRWRKLLYWVAALMLVYTLFGFLALPLLLRSVLPKRLTTELGRETSIASVRVNPYALSATVRGLLIKDKDGQPFLSWEELYVNFQTSSLFSGGWDFHSFLLRTPYVRLQLNPDQSWNFSDLLERTNSPPSEPEPPTTEEPRPFRVGKLQVSQGRVDFTDLTRPAHFNTVVGPFEITLEALTTLAQAANPYSFLGTTTAGEKFSWTGSLVFSPFASQGKLAMSGLTLSSYAPYYQDQLQCDIRAGVAELKANYHLALGNKANVLQITNSTFTLSSLAIAEKGATGNTIDIPRFTLSGGNLNLFQRIIQLDQISTEGGRIEVRRSPEGVLNLAILFSPPNRPDTPSSTPPNSAPSSSPEVRWTARLGKFDLRDYAIRLQDASIPRPVELNLDDVSLQARHLSNQPGTNASTLLSLKCGTNGIVRLDGSLGLFPPAADLEIVITDFPLRPVDRYLDSILNLLIQDGNLGLQGRLNLSLPTDAPPVVGFQGDLDLQNFVVTELPSEQTLCKWYQLQLRDLDLKLNPVEVSLGEVLLDDLYLRVLRDQTNLNLAKLVKTAPVSSTEPDPAQPPPAPAAAAATAPAPKINLSSMTLSNAHIRFRDHSNLEPVELALDNLALQLKNVSNRPGTNIGVNLRFLLNTNATIKTEGTVDINPLNLDLALDLEQIELETFNPYLDPFLNLEIIGGFLDLKGRARTTMRTNSPLMAGFQGDIALHGLTTKDTVLNQDFLHATNFTVTGLDFELQPPVVSINEVGISGFSFHIINDHGTNNLAGLLKQSTNSTPPQPAPAQPPPSGPKPRINITQVTLANSRMEFNDRSLSPAVRLSLDELQGSLSNISSERVGVGQVSLAGKINRAAPLKIDGRLDLLTKDKDTDLKVLLEKVEMLPFGSYVAKFLGYKLNQGQLNIDLKTAIKGRQLTSDNLIAINGFTLGDSVPGTNAVKAPVKLGIALLTDSQGKIELDIPVEGNLDDPEFRYGKVAWRAVLNLLLKAATSPFSLLAKVAGGKAEELSFLDFAAGQSQLQDISKLESLAKVLRNRPGLNLEVSGHYEEGADTDGLRRIKLADQLRLKKLAALREAGQTIASPDQIPFTSRDYTNAVLQAFATSLSAQAGTSPTVRPSLSGVPKPDSFEPIVPGAPSPKPPLRIRHSPLKGAELLIQHEAKPSREAERGAGAAQEASGKSDSARRKPAPGLQPSGKDLAQTPSGSASGVSGPPAAASQLSFAQLEGQQLASIELEQVDLRALAAQRAQRVREFLMKQGKISAERLVVPELTEQDPAQAGSRVYFQLR